MRQTHTGVVERNAVLAGELVTKPMEAVWASEALSFVEVLDAPEDGEPGADLLCPEGEAAVLREEEP